MRYTETFNFDNVLLRPKNSNTLFGLYTLFEAADMASLVPI